MRYSAVVFDLFGTLVPKWPVALMDQTLSRMARSLDVPPASFKNTWTTFHSDLDCGRISVKESFARAGASPVGSQPMREAFDIWSELVRAQVRPRDQGVLETLEECRTAGLKVGLASNCGDDVPGFFRRSEMASLIDFVGFSAELGVAKPDQRMFNTVCGNLSVSPSVCLFVGDGGCDELRGAQRAGMYPVFLRVDEEIDREGLPEGAVGWEGRTVSNLREILPLAGISKK